ncbi:MAG: alpha/beta hydrolase [Pseudomonadota bacterium]
MSRFETEDGLSLHYDDEGEGDPILCLAGLTRNGRDFDEFAAALPEGFRVVRLDSRGRGRSDRDPNFNNYNVMKEAADALALLDHLGIERTIVVGSSRGGLLAMVTAATAPQRLRGVVLNDVGPVVDPKGVEKIMSYLGRPPEATTMEEAATALETAFGGDFPGAGTDFWRYWAERGFDETDEGLAVAYDPKLRDAVEAQAASFDPEGPGLWPLFAALGPIPTLLLRGENSDLLSAETAAEMEKRKPDLKVAVVQRRGHIPRLNEPDAIGPILDFIGGLDD